MRSNADLVKRARMNEANTNIEAEICLNHLSPLRIELNYRDIEIHA
jgi:hypothetical protein